LERWIRLRGSGAGFAQLRTEISATIKPFTMVADLITRIGGGLLRMGGQPGITNVLGRLSQMGPGLGRLLNAFANNVGPQLVSSATSVLNLFADLGTGPLPVAVHGIGAIANFIDDIVKMSGPFRGLFTTAFSTLLISRYLVKLGLLQKGWFGVAVAAREAGTAEALASGGGGSTILGPTGLGIKGLFGRIRGGIGSIRGNFAAGRMAAGAEQGLAGAAEGGALDAAMTGAVAGGGLRGIIGGLGGVLTGGAEGGGLLAGAGSLAMGVASKVFLPLMGIQALLGGLTAARNGSFARQAGQTALGAANALTFGLAGKIGGLNQWAMTPAGVVQSNQGMLNSQLQGVGGRGIRALDAEVTVLKAHLQQFAGSQDSASKQYVQSLRQEIAQREQLVHQLRAEKTARQRGRAAGFNEMEHQEAPGLFRRYGALGAARRLDTAGAHYAFGMTSRGARLGEEHLLLANVFHAAQRDPTLMPEFSRLRHTFTRHEHGLVAFVPQAHGVRMLTGTVGERHSLQAQLRAARSANIDGSENARIRNLLMLLRTQRRVELIALGAAIVPSIVAAAAAASRARSQAQGATTPRSYGAGTMNPHAGGGRIGGMGLRDTVPVPGGMAAPGELIVNRHTEARVNSLLNPMGMTLGGMVGAETRPHSMGMRFATGGRTGFHGFPAVKPTIARLANIVLGRFPGLSVTSTVRPEAGSYHSIGEAVDIGGSSSLMYRAASWIGRNLGGQLLEGIHNPDLSIKNGQRVRPSFWGGSTWAGHLNHIHMAAGNQVIGGGHALAGAAAGAGRMAMTAGQKAAHAVAAGARNLGLGSVLDPGNLSGLGGIFTRNWAAASGAGTGMGHHGTVAAGGGGAVGMTGGTPDRNRALARAMLGDAGQWPYLDKLWTRESGFSQTAKNPSSGAYGIPQSLPASKMASAGADYLTNPRTQIKWGLGYIHGRYGSPSGAWAHEQSHGWYAKGGRMPFAGWFGRGGSFTATGPTMLGVGERGRPETVTVGKPGGHTFTANVYVQGGGKDVARQVADEVDKVMRKFARQLEHQPVDGADMAVT
jgi:hypothetical protein